MATSQALCLPTLPFDTYLVLFTHLHLTSFILFGRSTRFQVSFVIKEQYFSFIIVSQSGWLYVYVNDIVSPFSETLAQRHEDNWNVYNVDM